MCTTKSDCKCHHLEAAITKDDGALKATYFESRYIPDLYDFLKSAYEILAMTKDESATKSEKLTITPESLIKFKDSLANLNRTYLRSGSLNVGTETIKENFSKQYEAYEGRVVLLPKRGVCRKISKLNSDTKRINPNRLFSPGKEPIEDEGIEIISILSSLRELTLDVQKLTYENLFDEVNFDDVIELMAESKIEEAKLLMPEVEKTRKKVVDPETEAKLTMMTFQPAKPADKPKKPPKDGCCVIM